MKHDGVVPLSRRGLGRLLAGALGVLAGSRLSAGVAKRKKRRKDKPPDQPPCPPDGDDGSSAALDGEARAFLTRINDYRGANGQARFRVGRADDAEVAGHRRVAHEARAAARGEARALSRPANRAGVPAPWTNSTTRSGAGPPRSSVFSSAISRT